MSASSSERMEAQRQFDALDDKQWWKQTTGELRSRYHYARTLGSICHTEGDFKAAYSAFLTAEGTCAELENREPGQWQRQSAELEYAMAIIVSGHPGMFPPEEYVRRVSQHVSRAKKLDPAQFGHLDAEDMIH